MLRGVVTALSVVVSVVVIYAVILGAFLTRMVQHSDDVRVLPSRALASLGTGDIVLFRHAKYFMPAMFGANRIVSHMAVLWRHPTEGLCVVDMNPDRNGPYGSTLPFTPVLTGRKLIVYTLADAVRTYPGELFVRRLKKPVDAQDELCLGSMIVNWASNLEYVDTIANRDLVTYLGFIFGIMTREIGQFIAMFSPLAAPRTASFCTEMIAELFTRCGVLDLSVLPQTHGPINWLHGLGESAAQFAWDEEVQVVV